MNIQWLCFNVIGKVLAGEEFPSHFQKLPNKPVYSKEELKKFLATEEGLDFDLTVLLLEHLKILFITDDEQYLIPSKLPPSLPSIQLEKKENSKLYGIRVECVDESDMFSPELFPHILLDMLECNPESQGQANYSNSAIKFVTPIEGVIQETDMRKGINVAVVCKEKDMQKVHAQLQTYVTLTIITMKEKHKSTS